MNSEADSSKDSNGEAGVVPVKPRLTKEQREAKRVAREMAKANAELEKLKKKLASDRKREAREALAENARRAKRNFLPDVYPGWGAAECEQNIRGMENFELVCGEDIHAHTVMCLSMKTYSDVFKALSGFFIVDRTEVCLVERRTIKRYGEDVGIFSFRYVYSQEFNHELKERFSGKFDSHCKCWNVVCGDEDKSTDTPLMAIGDYFQVVIFLDTLSVYRNKSQPKERVNVGLAINKIDCGVQLDLKTVIHELQKYRPADAVEASKVYVYAGEVFERYDDSYSARFYVDKALFRYSVPGGQLRYALFDTMLSTVIGVIFGGNSDSRVLIARYYDSVSARSLKVLDMIE